MRANRQNNKESGMAMVLVITILAALLGIAAIGLSLQLNSTKSTGLVKDTRAALYCAEAGLAEARATLLANRFEWNDALDGTFTTWYPNALGIQGDMDADTVVDYQVTIRDDGETDGDPGKDSNDTIIVTSTCVKFLPSVPASVVEVISLGGLGQAYRSQSGQGAGNTGNAN